MHPDDTASWSERESVSLLDSGRDVSTRNSQFHYRDGQTSQTSETEPQPEELQPPPPPRQTLKVRRRRTTMVQNHHEELENAMDQRPMHVYPGLWAPSAASTPHDLIDPTYVQPPRSAELSSLPTASTAEEILENVKYLAPEQLLDMARQYDEMYRITAGMYAQ
jgi:hypothetical protein